MILCLFICLSLAESCGAFESGFYPVIDDEKLAACPDKKDTGAAIIVPNSCINQAFKDVQLAAAQADRTLWCIRQDEVEIKANQGEVELPKVLRRKNLKKFLRHEKEKNLLVAWFSKNMCSAQEIKTSVPEFRKFFKPLGYRRVLILGASSAGLFVFYDSMQDSIANPASSIVSEREILRKFSHPIKY